MAQGRAAAVSLRWGVPVTVVHQPPYSSPHHLNGIACPSAGVCVAVDDVGNVASSSDPSGGEAAWKFDRIDPGGYLAGVSCPSVTLCVAVDDRGVVLTSRAPTAGANAWTAAVVDPGNTITAISCPSTALCVAVDRAGNLISTSDPTGGAAAWRLAHLDGVQPIVSVTCPTSSLCVAGAAGGDVITSTDPTAGAGAWSPAHVDDAVTPCLGGGCLVSIHAISCPSASLCVGFDDAGNVLSSTDPTGGRSAWSTSPLGLVSAVSCPSASSCVGVGDYNGIFTSADPGGGAAAWTRANVPLVGLDGVSCPTTSFCAAVGSDKVTTSGDPGGGAGTWRVFELDDGTNTLNPISCAPGPICAVTDFGGHVASSADPAGGRGSWHTAEIDPVTHVLTTMSCASWRLCVTADVDDRIAASTNLTGSASAWSFFRVPGLHAGFPVSCPSATFCATVDALGRVATSTNPAQGAVAWHVQSVLGVSSGPRDITCASSVLCLILDGASIAVSSSPGSGAAAWKELPLDPNGGLLAASCPSQKFCAVLGDEGTLSTSTLFTSTEPAGPASSWRATKLQRATRVYCATTSLCFLTTEDTQIAVSADPRGGASAWRMLKAPVPIFSISCVSQTLCVGAGREQVVPVRVTAPAAAPTSAEIRARLIRALTVRGRRARLSEISKRGGYRLRFSAPEAGKLVIRWYLPRHGRHADTLIAGASTRFTSRATRVIKVSLTLAGRRFLHGIRKPHRIRLRASGSFTPAGHRAVRVTKLIELAA